MASFSYNTEPNHNPWISEDKYLESIKSALLLGERTGHVKSRYQNESSFEELDTEEEMPASLNMIVTQREISQKRREINEVNLEIQKRMQDRETHDITRLDKLESKIEKIKNLNNHIANILKCKDDIVNRLQQPLVGDYIKIDADYHRYASEVFPILAPLLGNLKIHFENIEWYKSAQFMEGRTKLDSVLLDLSSAFATMQSEYQALGQMRRSMNELYQTKCPN